MNRKNNLSEWSIYFKERKLFKMGFHDAEHMELGGKPCVVMRNVSGKRIYIFADEVYSIMGSDHRCMRLMLSHDLDVKVYLNHTDEQFIQCALYLKKIEITVTEFINFINQIKQQL